MMTTKEDLMKYTESHEWISVEDGVATIGITDHAQQALGDIVFVELPQVGQVLAKGDSFGVVESVKAASDVYCPVSGEVIETNDELSSSPERINEAACDDGWMIKVKLSHTEEIDALLSHEQYNETLEG